MMHESSVQMGRGTCDLVVCSHRIVELVGRLAELGRKPTDRRTCEAVPRGDMGMMSGTWLQSAKSVRGMSAIVDIRV